MTNEAWPVGRAFFICLYKAHCADTDRFKRREARGTTRRKPKTHDHRLQSLCGRGAIDRYRNLRAVFPFLDHFTKAAFDTGE